MKVSWDDEIPNVWKINTYSKQPTRIDPKDIVTGNFVIGLQDIEVI